MKLQNKFLAVLLPAGMLSGGLLLFLIHRAVHAVIIGGLERGSVELARSAVRETLPGLRSGKESDLLPALQALQRREGALYVAALDPRGRVAAHTTISERGKIENDALTAAALGDDRAATWLAEVRGEPALIVAVPVRSPDASLGEAFLMSGEDAPRARLGLLKVAVPLRAAQETERQIIREISVIVVALGLAVFGLVIVLVRGILAPIRALMSGIARIGEGSYDVKVPVQTRDELGGLAESFNSMSGALARTTVSKEYVEGILENMNDLLVVTDNGGLIQTVNQAAAEALGVTSAEMVGRPLSAVFATPPAEGDVRDAEVVLSVKNGGRMPALYSSSPLRGRDGGVRGHIGVAKDITERKRAEEALLAAKLAAEASSRELEAFSYSVAHDLRAPLRSVDGFSKILLDRYAGQVDEAGKDYLRRVRGASNKMGQLIDDLLNLSRITRSALSLERVDLSALARDIGVELAKAEPGRRVELVVAPDLTARGDARLLRVALVNLLANSWKYTSKHARARVEFGVERLDGKTVFFVRDDGAGFDMEFSKRLFQPFSRLHAASEFEGTGIGLATVQRVISRHDGKVWGEGAVEGGATFYFTLWEGKS